MFNKYFNEKIDMIKLIFTILGIIFATINLMKPSLQEFTMPITHTFLGLIMLINGRECYLNKDKPYAYLFFITAIFVFIVSLYTTFF